MTRVRLAGIAEVHRGRLRPGDVDGIAVLTASTLNQAPPADGRAPEGAVTVKRYDVIVTLHGARRSLLADERHHGLALGHDCALLRALPATATMPGWLYAWTLSSDFANQAAAHTTGSALPTLPARALSEFTVPVVPLDEQQRIAAISEHFDTAIHAAKSTVDDLTALRRASIHLDFATDDQQAPRTNP